MSTATQQVVRADHKRMFFSAWSVRQLIAGKKRQTRRIIKLPDWCYKEEIVLEEIDGVWQFIPADQYDRVYVDRWEERKPKYKKGHTYLVAEPLVQSHYEDCIQYEADERFVLRDEPMGCLAESVGADPDTMSSFKIEWPYKPGRMPSIFCRKEYCRYAVRIEDVRVERLQDITHQDILAEGIEIRGPDHLDPGKHARDSFQAKWTEINGDGAWGENPFVFVYELSPLIEID